MRTIGTIAATCIVVVMVGPWVVGETVPYALSDWSCGVIIWPHEIPDYVENFTLRLTEAAETAFGFWGYELRSPAEEPYNEAKAFRIYDPAIDAERIVPPLEWNNREIPPVVVFAFRNELAMRSALGRTDLWGAIWCVSSMSRAFPDSEKWIREIGTGYRNLICPSLTPIETLIHEDAHWFTTEWCSLRGIDAFQLPNYIMEGIAETTCATTKDPNDAVYDRLRAIAWAQNNCLYGNIEGVMRYSVGESLVCYLIETLGTEGFLSTLQTWTRRPLFMADLYQADWRTSLGLPTSCPE